MQTDNWLQAFGMNTALLLSRTVIKRQRESANRVMRVAFNKNCDSLTQLSQHHDQWQAWRKDVLRHTPHSGAQRERTCAKWRRGSKEPELPGSGINELHAQRAQGERVVLVSPAGHAQHVKVRAEEQHVRECAENTWVSTWTSKQPVETAKTLPKRRPHMVKKV